MFDDKKLDIGYKVYSLTEKPKIIEDGDNFFKLGNVRSNATDTLVNMLCATCKPLHVKIKEIKKDGLYLADNELYVLGNIESAELEKYRDMKVNVDGYSDINLEQWLNLDVINKENVSVVY